MKTVIEEDKTHGKRVSIVVLNYGYKDFLLECLQSIEDNESRDAVELILVDNGTDTPEWNRIAKGIESRHITVDRLIRLKTNGGFSIGMNAGLLAAGGDVVVALNNDTIVGRSAVTALLDAAARPSERVGFLAIPVYVWRYGNGLSTCSLQLEGEVVGLTSYVSVMPLAQGSLKRKYVLGPPGSAVIMMRALIDQMVRRYGFVYDPHFFAYGEDVDLFLRARQAGFRTVLLGGDPSRQEVIWHIGSGTSAPPGIGPRTINKETPFIRLILNGMLDNIRRHGGLMDTPLLLAVHVIFRAVVSAILVLKGRQLSEVMSLWKPVRRNRVRFEKPLAGGLMPLLRTMALGYNRPLPWARTCRQVANQRTDHGVFADY